MIIALKNNVKAFLSNCLKVFYVCYFLIFSTSCLIFHLVGGTGRLKTYTYKGYAKKEINAAIQCLFLKYPQYKPPIKYRNTMIHYYSDLSTPESKSINADSVQFHFYINGDTTGEVLYWTAFTGCEKEWTNKSPELLAYGYVNELDLIGYKKNDGRMNIQEDFKKKTINSDIYVKQFELIILSKIKYFLENPTKCK